MSAAHLPYVGRFAPSPSGPLHAGSLAAAMASYLDARLHGGVWLLRIEDIDETRTVPDAIAAIRQALSALGMHWDHAVATQSERKQLYQAACERLGALVYPCACTRKEIIDSVTRIGLPRAADGAAIYPGTCRNGVADGKIGRTLRIRVPDADDPQRLIHFDDRWFGPLTQDLASETGDFVLKRADGFWAYQLAVVVDDAAQGVTDVVRGADLIDSTARQIYLQRLLGVPTPAYLHVPLLAGDDGEKLSKQNGAPALDLSRPLRELSACARFLGLESGIAANTDSVDAFWPQAIAAWERRLHDLPQTKSQAKK
ncbi:MAG: glutamyl-Q tRNA(Asp) ligase [Herbaspirillum sp.]|jgi:glutamyl-Q tRNA(Asp) synthetase|nr:glutamyl-Q tRNA(Asp) ligase [Herbaspirillum sp.]